MTLENIITLLNAGYTKDEIQALEKGTGSPEEKPADPKPEEKPEEKPAAPVIDYAKLSRELMKAAAGKDTGAAPDHKTKEEQVEEAMLSFVR